MVIIVVAADSGVERLNWFAVFKESSAWLKMKGTHVLITWCMKNMKLNSKKNAKHLGTH